ncbi:MAG TPA: hypothetical protein VH083_17195 [Myxococcales bacterium]|jgi:hypothetical protein|nr:hypothetical protein [Myxococcales bacterium]
MPQKQTNEENAPVRFEQSPWMAKELHLEEPRRYSGDPLQLSEEHVVDALLDGDSIRRIF